MLREDPSLISPGATVPSSPIDWSGLPIVYDEVFTGLYRLGRFNCSSFLQADPDIVVNAKLLTGGLVPLCTTTASQSVFEAFLSDEKSDALLHGHSYTAHAVGCNVAVESLDVLMNLEKGQVWDAFKSSWAAETGTESTPAKATAVKKETVWSMWSLPFVNEVSQNPAVDHVIALGSVLAIALKDDAGAGKPSSSAFLSCLLFRTNMSQDIPQRHL
jgi:dethiobiotin synthetase/adenosylmethionine--8-amino-7-oxononanoate aminotransferase